MCECFSSEIDYLENGDITRPKELVNRQINLCKIFLVTHYSVSVAYAVIVETIAFEETSDPRGIRTSAFNGILVTLGSCLPVERVER